MNSTEPQAEAPHFKASPIAILGIPFDPVTRKEAIGLIAAMITSRHPHYAVTANVDFVVQAQSDAELRRIIFDAHLVLCDGMPLVWASRHLGNALPERVAGSDLTPLLLAEAELRGWRVFFLGGTPHSVERAASRTLERHPRINLVGAYSPPFSPLLEMDQADILRRVTEVRPDLLFVAFGCPKQEKWMHMHYRTLGVPFCMGIGAAIDFIAGTFRRAPVWMQRAGLEWLFRLAQEPRRLARRYGRDAIIFGRSILSQARQMRETTPRRSSPSRPAPEGPQAPAPAPHKEVRMPPAEREGPEGVVPPHEAGEPMVAPSRLDAAAARELSDSWPARVEREAVTHIDLGAAEFVDSTGVGLLVRLQKVATAHHRSLLLCRPRPQLTAALRLMRIDSFFKFSETLPGASSPDQGMAVAPQAADPATRRLTIAWAGEITRATVGSLAHPAEHATSRLAPGGVLAIDLSGVPFVDSAGLGLMVRLRKDGWQRDVAVVFVRPSDGLRAILQATRLEEYLTQEPDRTGAPASSVGVLR